MLIAQAYGWNSLTEMLRRTNPQLSETSDELLVPLIAVLYCYVFRDARIAGVEVFVNGHTLENGDTRAIPCGRPCVFHNSLYATTRNRV